MKRRIVILVIASCLACLVYLRWPRIEADSVFVSYTKANSNAFEVEYRMRQPFRVWLSHRLGERLKVPANQTGIFVGSVQTTRNELTVFSSRYDWIRGEHFVRLVLSKGNDILMANGNGEVVSIPIWSGKAVYAVKWATFREGFFLGDGVGTTVAIIDEKDENQVETLDVQAGSNSYQHNR